MPFGYIGSTPSGGVLSWYLYPLWRQQDLLLSVMNGESGKRACRTTPTSGRLGLMFLVIFPNSSPPGKFTSTRASLGPPRFLFHQESSGIIRPALRSTLIAVVVEIPLCLFFSLFLALPFARYISGSSIVADITAHMWRTIDWCYIFYALSTQFATILLATKPKWYLVNSALVNIFWVLPWAIAMQVGINVTERLVP